MEEKPLYLGHRKRLRERFGKGGAEGFHDYELLELLLTYAIPRCDVKPIAKKLIKRFGNLSGVLDSGQQELEDVEEIGPASATLIRLVKELQGKYLYLAPLVPVGASGHHFRLCIGYGTFL